MIRENTDKFDIVFTDKNMPIMSGIVMAENIARDKELGIIPKDLKIVLVTGESVGLSRK